MKIDRAQVYMGLGILAVLSVYFVGRKAVQGAAAVGSAINPVNRDNVFAAGVNAVGGVLVTEPDGAGKNADGSWTFGGWLYDVTHPATAKTVASMSGTVQKSNVSDPATFTPADNTAVQYAYDPTPQYDPMGNYVGPQQ